MKSAHVQRLLVLLLHSSNARASERAQVWAPSIITNGHSKEEKEGEQEGKLVSAGDRRRRRRSKWPVKCCCTRVVAGGLTDWHRATSSSSAAAFVARGVLNYPKTRGAAAAHKERLQRGHVKHSDDDDDDEEEEEKD